jgi:hypothetical protein
MGTTRKQYFNLGLVLAVGLTISGRGEAEDSKMRSEIAVHVYNYARVNQETLAEAEKVAAGIFGKAGVEIRWVEVQCSSGAKPATQNERTSVSRSYIQLDILTHEMFDRLGLPHDVMGAALGAGPNGKYAYVSYSRADALFLGELSTQGRGIPHSLASRGQILGHAFAHEMGHILLNTTNHSPSGIMRGVWDFRDLNDASSGQLLFSAEQGKILRTEVLKRAAQQEGNTVDSEEMARLIH